MLSDREQDGDGQLATKTALNGPAGMFMATEKPETRFKDVGIRYPRWLTKPLPLAVPQTI